MRSNLLSSFSYPPTVFSLISPFFIPIFLFFTQRSVLINTHSLLARNQTRAGGALLGVLLCAQVTLGILNVWLFLPLPNAVAHNGTGALLLAAMVWLLHRSRPRFA